MVCPDALSGHLLQGRLNQNSIWVESVRPLGSYVDHCHCFAMDSKELSSISDCFGDRKAIKTPKLNTIWLELIARVLNMLIGLKGNNYYSKVFKRVNYKLSNSTFWVVIKRRWLILFFNFIQSKTHIHMWIWPLYSIRIKTLKARHDVTKLNLIVPLLSFWYIDIDLSMQPMSFTLYMTCVH